ncbi:MAG: glycoside hydrolase family 32 protein [Mucilaginibacter sp.]|nr:glycoside hydrolase family 32 protein [Mucilaginibacter sp.]
MKNNLRILAIQVLMLASFVCKAQDAVQSVYKEEHRPQLHFSPKAHWINDPNGMVYFNNTYHLFYQYYPNGTIWGPMHWGHATSTDLFHWKELPIALYPDSLGYIFSGSAVADVNNTSGFGKGGKIPLIAIFTHHDPKGEKENTDKFQNQSLAYSLDEGVTWTKYNGNPVLKNPGIRDFRDPKVMWYAAEKKWVMTLATKDRITFYSAPDLKTWKKESEFGLTIGAHGGVWECPDLFPLQLGGKTYWVLLVNLNPGGPNGGSATQYFVGQFDGKTFTPADTKTRWIDYGPDEYAGVTWSNTGVRKIFLGWMTNWSYANQVPTVAWRNAMTIPRELSLKKMNGQLLVASTPVKEIKNIVAATPVISLNPSQVYNLPAQSELKISTAQIQDIVVTFSNANGERVTVGYDKQANQYYIDRTQSGKTDFQKSFKGRFVAPRFTSANNADITLVVDAASVELFADNGLTVMTGIYFPNATFNKVSVSGSKDLKIKLTELTSIHNR